MTQILTHKAKEEKKDEPLDILTSGVKRVFQVRWVRVQGRRSGGTLIVKP
jgi:hypothetical protein